LLEIVAALHQSGRLPHRLHRWQEHRRKQGDDRDHRKQFDERQTTCGVPSQTKTVQPHFGFSVHNPMTQRYLRSDIA